ncbi:MAG: terminase small subunit [Geobacteraceae bacterium]|nr:terminase small subunit [Geobacteraceae bacterium]
MTSVPGQIVLPEFVDELGFESAALPPKQEAFCWEYILRNSSKTDAYLAAFPNVSRKSAAVNAIRLLKDAAVQARIEQIKAELQRRYSVSADSIVFHLSQILNVDRAEFLDEAGNVRPIHEIPTEAKRILDLDFVTDRHGNQKALYRLPKRLDAAVELSKIMGLVKNPVKPVEGDSPTTGIQVEFVQPGSVQAGDHARVNFYIPENHRDEENRKLDELRKRFDEHR